MTPLPCPFCGAPPERAREARLRAEIEALERHGRDAENIISALRAEIDEALMLTECFSSLKDMTNGVVGMQAEITRLRAQVDSWESQARNAFDSLLLLGEERDRLRAQVEAGDKALKKCAGLMMEAAICIEASKEPAVSLCADLRRAAQANGSEG